MDELHRSPAVAQIGTGPVSDAMEQLQLPRSVITGWRYINPDPTATLIGPAYTLRQAAKGRAVAHDEDRTRQRDVVGELAQPGDVIVIDVGGRTDVCTWGENHSMRWRTKSRHRRAGRAWRGARLGLDRPPRLPGPLPGRLARRQQVGPGERRRQRTGHHRRRPDPPR
ncbi:MAG: hypothetical protein U0232_26620 [Thermomicrobiales bacterium]